MSTEQQAGATAPSTESPLLGRVHELEEKVRAHEEFLSALGHELRNPLSPLYMQSQYLLDVARQTSGDSIPKAWLIPRLQTFCRRLQNFVDLLNRIMDVSRISAGRMGLELEDVEFSELLRDICASLERELTVARSELRTDIADKVVGLWDRMRLEQVCLNLLSNAIRYGAGKPIEVSLSADALHARLTVRDHGIGIAKEDQGRIFQRFERAAPRRHSSGLGIGLWIVKETCLAMGGNVEVQSELGSGSTFIVTLPRRPGAHDG